MKDRWDKLLSREFLATIGGLVFSGIAMLKGIVPFAEWAVFAGGLILGYQGVKVYKDTRPLENGSDGEKVQIP